MSGSKSSCGAPSFTNRPTGAVFVMVRLARTRFDNLCIKIVFAAIEQMFLILYDFICYSFLIIQKELL